MRLKCRMIEIIMSVKTIRRAEGNSTASKYNEQEIKTHLETVYTRKYESCFGKNSLSLVFSLTNSLALTLSFTPGF